MLVYVGFTHSSRAYSLNGHNYLVNPLNQEILVASDVLVDVIGLIQREGNVESIISNLAEEPGLDQAEATIAVWDMLHDLRDIGMVELSASSVGTKRVSMHSMKGVGRALLSITHKCNFACSHCLQGSDSRFKELDTSSWYSIIDQLSEMGNSHIFFTGGEPLLRRDAPDLMERAAEHSFPVRLFTNAFLVDDDLVRRLAKIDSLIVQVSFHSIASADFDHFVGIDGAFDHVTKSIKSLADAGIRVSVATAFRDNLVPHMDEFPSLLQKLGVTEWIPTLIMPLGCAYESWQNLRMSNQNMRAFMDNLFRLMSTYKGSKDFSVFSPFDISMLQCDQEEWKAGDISFGCSPYEQYINIQPDGSVTPCDRLTDYTLGSLKEETLSDILSKKELIQTHILEVKGKLASIGADKRCQACTYNRLCGFGCPGIQFQGKSLGEQHDDPVVCRMFNECFDIVLKYATPPAKEKMLKELNRD